MRDAGKASQWRSHMSKMEGYMNWIQCASTPTLKACPAHSPMSRLKPVFQMSMRRILFVLRCATPFSQIGAGATKRSTTVPHSRTIVYPH
jgi:hypothetical protein